MAARQGFEPRYAAPEAAVLPLNDRAKQLDSSRPSAEFGRCDTHPESVPSRLPTMEDSYNSTENFGLMLSGPLTFFFSTVYLQEHANRLARGKKMGQLW